MDADSFDDDDDAKPIQCRTESSVGGWRAHGGRDLEGLGYGGCFPQDRSVVHLEASPGWRGAPDRDVGLPTNPDDLIEDAGIVFAFRVPIDGPNGTDHALAGGPLYEPADHINPGQMLQAGPKRHGRFGAWIVTGRYNINLAHEQFVICARERPLGTSTLVGQVYSFRMQ